MRNERQTTKGEYRRGEYRSDTLRIQPGKEVSEDINSGAAGRGYHGALGRRASELGRVLVVEAGCERADVEQCGCNIGASGRNVSASGCDVVVGGGEPIVCRSKQCTAGDWRHVHDL
jgi:hypothetical protein